MTWLNVGCGTFLAPSPWINLDGNGTSIADNFADGRERATERRPDVLAWSDRLPYPDGSVARIYAGHVLEHMDLYGGEVDRSLAEFKRVLMPGGQLLCVGPDLIRTAEWVCEGKAEWRLFWESHGTAGRGNPAGPAYKNAARGDVHLWSTSNEAVYAILSKYWRHVSVRPIEGLDPDWPCVSRVGWQSSVMAIADP